MGTGSALPLDVENEPPILTARDTIIITLFDAFSLCCEPYRGEQGKPRRPSSHRRRKHLQAGYFNIDATRNRFASKGLSGVITKVRPAFRSSAA